MQNNSNELNGAVIPYIAVLLGLLLSAGILGWFITSRNTPEPVPEVTQEAKLPTSMNKNTDASESIDISDARLPDITAVYETESYDPLKSTPMTTVLTDTPTEEAAPTASLIQSIRLIPPASGEIIYDYSDNHPAYNETMRDWRVHNAVDFAVQPGEIATAAADGMVDSIYDDRLLGKVIVLSHFGGYKSIYANLSEHVLVEEGQSVKQGDPLCEIGGSAVMELFLPEHLHFALFKDDTPVNPSDFWKE